ncbi:MAG: excinuclease subunit, partial [Gaiellaceae bacterium]|nr:excinuclease subunit [Gaiellaceae bacterium]
MAEVRDKLAKLPAKPGVYLFRDGRGEVLYVGKAKSLRPRVRSYFGAGRGDARHQIPRLVDRIADVEVIVTGTEVEALHLEQNLVKRHRPPFNVRLRDDKSFPYIAVTVEDEYPRVMFTRERHRRGVVYFGPYANAKKVRETLDVLNRVFQFRPCEGPKPGRHSGIPCLDYHIERCHAPCVGYITKELYGELIEEVIEFLSGETRPIVRALEQRMRDAAAEERYEDAARYRNRLFAIEKLAERQGADRRDTGSVDVIGIASAGDRAAVQVFPLRGGKMIDRHAFHLENVEGQDVTTILEAFCLEYYGNAPSIPPQLVVPPDVGDVTALGEWLSSRRGVRVEVRAPARGEKKRLAELAAQNATLALESETAQSEQKRLRRVEALEELREALNLESLPRPGRLRGDGRGDRAALRAAGRHGRGARRGLREHTEPRRHRRRQGPALRRAHRHAGLRPAPRGRDRARETGRGGVRAGPRRPDPARPAPPRAAAAPAHPRRGAPLRPRLPPAAPRR